MIASFTRLSTACMNLRGPGFQRGDAGRLEAAHLVVADAVARALQQRERAEARVFRHQRAAARDASFRIALAGFGAAAG